MSYAELAKRLQVSEITVRRDLSALQDEGLVEKVVGGGKMARSADEPTFLSKRALHQVEKQNIAKLAMTLIEPGMTVGLSAGTTTWTLAKAIRGITNLTFVTNSTNIALELKSNGYSDIYLTGGHFRTPSDALVGPLAEAAVRKLHTDILFLGVHGIDFTYGLSTPNLLEASVNSAFMERTECVVLVFDHSKWGIRALAHIADIDDVDIIVTDDGGPGFNRDAIHEKGVRLLVASGSDESESESAQCHR